MAEDGNQRLGLAEDDDVHFALKKQHKCPNSTCSTQINTPTLTLFFRLPKKVVGGSRAKTFDNSLGVLRHFNLDENSLPTLSVVQMFVRSYAASHLRNNDILASVTAKIREAALTYNEEGGEAFTFAWENDADGRLIVGNASDHEPFIIGVTTKMLLKRVDCDPGSFIFHIDATYNLCQVTYLVLVVRTSDKMRSSHLVAIFFMSQQVQLHHARALAALPKVYLAVMQKPLVVRYVTFDADKAQRNAVDDVFGSDCVIVHLLFLFHVFKTFYEKANSLEASLYAKVLHDVYDLHFTICGLEIGIIRGIFLGNAAASRFSQWQTYHSPSGMAIINSPVEQYITVLEHDVTIRRKPKVVALLGHLLDWCRLENARAAPRTYNEDLRRRNEDPPVSAQLGLNIARMETMDMPSTGWKVDDRLMVCPCRFFEKFACCTHILFAQNTRGHIDLLVASGWCTVVLPRSAGRLLIVKAQAARHQRTRTLC
ncbi:hypothetical protein F444_16971 [Phytophthora nicotianae P1976]|uniref:MULE transposase domain-containing protein n=1 Tax=Phytophthora nicotianae P1976 TaxID=1317066 RepID=A0A080ZGK1_PHYNI|nr:hypothetical protein F444_16971 [Phytophthora nicotianae P1976]